MDSTEQVNQFMGKLDRPFKAEVQMIREIIKNVNDDITEQIKWKAPSFNYKGEHLLTFNLCEKQKIHLVFHNPVISKVKSKLLEGDYDHRRLTYFSDEKDIKAKKKVLKKVLDLLRKSFRHTPVLAPGAVPGENTEKISFSQRSQWALWLGKGSLMQEVN